MIVSDDKMTVAFVNTTADPIKIEHICFFSKDKVDTVELFSVVREFYPHPTQPEDAQISLITTKYVGEYRKSHQSSGKAMVMLYGENVLREHFYTMVTREQS